MEKLANKLSNITQSIQNGNQVKSNWALPTNQYVQMAYNDPKFALGNLIGTYLLNRYVGNVDNGEAEDMQPKIPSGASPDYQSTLNTDNAHRFQVDENGNLSYHSPTLTPAIMADNPIQANQDFKDYYNSYNNNNVDGSGLLDMTQLAQLAGVAPTEQTTPVMPVLQAGTVNPNPLNGGNFSLDGDLGKYATTNPQSLTGGTWSYRGKFSPKNYGDIAAVVSPITDNTAMTDTTSDLFVPPKVVEIDKKQVLLPMVSKDGKLWTDQEAFDHYAETGENFGTFNTKEEAEKKAKELSSGGSVISTQTASTNIPANTSTNTPMYTIDSNFPGMIKAGNIDLANRPMVKLPDGKIATVRSTSFNIDGHEVLLPTVSKDGKLWTDQEAVDNYRKTGENLGIFNSPEAATKYAQALHEQQDKMYVRPNEQPITESQQPITENQAPIVEEPQPIQAELQPIKENQAPITEDKKEQLDGNALRIQSAKDGYMYNFPISNDGQWIQFPNGGKLPITEKEALIKAMHDPTQSYYGLELLATPLHNSKRELPQDIKDALKRNPNDKELIDLLTTNYVDSNDIVNAINEGKNTDNLRIGIPNTEQIVVNPNEPQPFNAEQWKRDFIIRQRKKGFSSDVINDMLGDLMPQAQAQEDKYNRYQAGILMPLYQTAVANKDYSTAAQLAQGMMQYNQEVGNYMLSSLPTAQNFYATDVAKDRAATAEEYKKTNMDIAQKYKEKNDKTAFENNKALKELTYQQQVQLKQLDEFLKEKSIAFSTQQKLAFAAASKEQQYKWLISHGATNEQALGITGGKGTSSRSSGGKVPQDVQKAYNNIMNKFNAGLSAVKADPNGEEAANAVEDLTKYVQDHKDNFDPSMASTMYAMAAMLEGFRYKMQGDNDDASERWQQVPSHLLKQYLGNDNSDLNFDEYPDW